MTREGRGNTTRDKVRGKIVQVCAHALKLQLIICYHDTSINALWDPSCIA